MRLGPYEVVRHLGAGGMSTVWLAKGPLPPAALAAAAAAAPNQTQAQAHGLVVLKRQIQPEEDASLREEARVGMRLQHPGVVRTWGTFDDDDKRPILILEYVPGASLSQLRKRGPLPPEAVSRIGADIAEALTALHDARDERGAALRILHRDVTPANIIVSHDGRARLIDLGIARSSESAVEKTATGSVKGTLRYVAPEIFEGKAHAPSTDLWALGVCLFEAALGRPAATGPEAAVLAAVVRGQLLTVQPSERIDPQLFEVIQRLCSADPEKRFPHARIAARRLAAGDVESKGAMLASVAVYAAVDEPRNPPARAAAQPGVNNDSGTINGGNGGNGVSNGNKHGDLAHPQPSLAGAAVSLGPASTSGDDGFALMAASTYCGEDDDPFADTSQASTVLVEDAKSPTPIVRSAPMPVTAVAPVAATAAATASTTTTTTTTTSTTTTTGIASAMPERVPHTPGGSHVAPEMAATVPFGVPAPARLRARSEDDLDQEEALALALPPTTPGTPGGASKRPAASADAWSIPQPITGEDGGADDGDQGPTRPQPISPPANAVAGALLAMPQPTTAPTDELLAPATDPAPDPDVARNPVDEPSRSAELVDLREQALGAPSVIAVVLIVVVVALGLLFALSR